MPNEKTPDIINISTSISSSKGTMPQTKLTHKNTVPLDNAQNCSTILTCSIPVIDKKNDSLILGVETSHIAATGSFLTVLLSLTVAASTIWKYSKDSKHQLKLLKVNEENDLIQRAKEKIENFYGPCNALLEESSVIYTHFAIKEKAELREAGSYFRTLRFLSESQSSNVEGIQRLETYDQKLLLQIAEISDQTLKLIEEKSGYIDNPELHSLLGRLAAHFRILKIAIGGELIGLNEQLESIVFPLEINGAIDNEINKLQRIIKPLKDTTKTKSNKTIKYYDDSYIEYHRKTNSINMSEIYRKVRKYVSNGSRILDAGSGIGRDTQYFLQHGFKVTSFDASKKMVDLCNEYPFAFCEHLDFESINYPSKFDLVWACASLLHISNDDFENIIYKLYKALKPEGHLYFSLKATISQGRNDTRKYYIYSLESIEELLVTKFNMTRVETWSTESNLNTNESFDNYIYRK